MVSQINYTCEYLITLCTKYKMDILNREIQKELKKVFQEECKIREYELKKLIFTPHSLTMQISFPPTESIQSVVNHFKRVSIKVIKNIAPETKTKLPNIWIKPYHVQTIGISNNDSIEQFINSQKTRKESRK